VRIRNRNVLQGVVHSASMDKTISVNIVRRYKHPKYGKYVLRTRRYFAHDEKNDARQGDTVVISETRPLSKTKRWRLIEVVERAPTREDRKS
jgi:small subunit ribosomal protein S17